jgi:hypothetical protein
MERLRSSEVDGLVLHIEDSDDELLSVVSIFRFLTLNFYTTKY